MLQGHVSWSPDYKTHTLFSQAVTRQGEISNQHQWFRDAINAHQAERVAFMAALRAIVGRRCAKNKAGAALVSDFDLVWATEDERKEAWETMKKNAK